MTTPGSLDVELAWSADEPLNDGFILREDEALKVHLGGIRVRDANSAPQGRPVKVYYRNPQHEAQQRTYPYLTIDLISVVRDASREHRGDYIFRPLEAYSPPGREPGELAKTDYPIPFLITYQITHFSRFVQHDRQLIHAMLVAKLPPRFGALPMTGSPDFRDDMSIRRMDFINGPINGDSPDPADPSKRIFRKAYTIEVSSEMFLSDINEVIQVAPDGIFLDVHTL